MTEISEQALERADGLAAEREPSMDLGDIVEAYRKAFALFIQQVSDAAEEVDTTLACLRETNVISVETARRNREALARFILPDPPVDPLEEALKETLHRFHSASLLPLNFERIFRAELAKSGLKIVESQP